VGEMRDVIAHTPVKIERFDPIPRPLFCMDRRDGLRVIGLMVYR
jgi:hypothetical protein